jgi:DNA-binding NarL/FixJ family response regulator
VITALLVDDHAVVRDGLRALLQAQPDMEVVGDASNGRDAVSQARQLHPDVVIMDIAMPKMNGVEATYQVRRACPSAQVVILSMHSTREHIFQGLQAGARGYLLKESAGAEVVDAVRAVHSGDRYLSRKIAATVVDDYVAERRKASSLETLSRRERHVLQLIAEGLSNAEAAAVLYLSPKTVETYRSRLMHKLGLDDVPALVKYAIQHGLVQLD